MQEQGAKCVLEVTPAEGGQKLLQFLQRRLSLPPTLLHRWIRTGQIRRNGGRCKPFDHVDAGDMVRLPPFALSMNQSAVEDAAARNQRKAESEVFSRATVPGSTGGRMPSANDFASAAALGAAAAEGARSTPTPAALPLPLPPLVYANAQLLVFNKPAGLPVHPGTGHSDSLATRLAAHHADAPFRPTPAHRLDKDTSGLLLTAAAYSTLRALQEAFKDRRMVKEYVAWVHGRWEGGEPRVLRHHLAKQYVGSDEKMRVQSAPSGAASAATDAKEAVCVVCCLRREETPGTPHAERSLLHIRLITGRTHQIRAQLAAAGHPLCGDFKYGVPEAGASCRNGARQGRSAFPRSTLYLHSLRIVLPDVPELAHMPREFAALPPWEGSHALREMPAPLTVSAP